MAKGLALKQNPLKETTVFNTAAIKTQLFFMPVCLSLSGMSFLSLHTNTKVNGLVSTVFVHRGDTEGSPERCQHSPTPGRSHHTALHQPHFGNHGNLTG